MGILESSLTSPRLNTKLLQKAKIAVTLVERLFRYCRQFCQGAFRELTNCCVGFALRDDVGQIMLSQDRLHALQLKQRIFAAFFLGLERNDRTLHLRTDLTVILLRARE